jgi:hypothetical protein
MPNVRITRQTVALKRNVRPGDELELSEADARLLINAGKAVLVSPQDKSLNASGYQTRAAVTRKTLKVKS